MDKVFPCLLPSQNGEAVVTGTTNPASFYQHKPTHSNTSQLERIPHISLNSRKGISLGKGHGSCLLFPLIAEGHLHTQSHLPALSFLGVVAAALSNNVPLTINPFMSPFLPGIARHLGFFFFFPFPFAPDFCLMPSGYCLLDKTSNPSPGCSWSLKNPMAVLGKAPIWLITFCHKYPPAVLIGFGVLHFLAVTTRRCHSTLVRSCWISPQRWPCWC